MWKNFSPSNTQQNKVIERCNSILTCFNCNWKYPAENRTTNIKKQFEELKKNILVKVSWRVKKTDAAGCTRDIVWKRGCIKLHSLATLPWKKNDFAVMDAWKTFSETFDWLSGARFTQNSFKQVFRISLQFFCYNTDGWTRCLCCLHIITLHFRIAHTNIPTQRL